MEDKFYKPFSPIDYLFDADIVVCRSEELVFCKYGSLVMQAFNWLKEHPQPNEDVRLKTAYLLGNYNESIKVEVAAALVADLLPDVSLFGLLR